MNYLDYVEQQANANMQFHLDNLTSLKKEADGTLKILFLILSGTTGYTIKLLEGGRIDWAFVVGSVTAYLIFVAIYLTVKCLKTGDVQAPTNEPKNLLLKTTNNEKSEELRKLELENLQDRIKLNRERNVCLGKHLNAARLMVCYSPLAFVASWIIFYVAARFSCTH
jgi:hypothetical protein